MEFGEKSLRLTNKSDPYQLISISSQQIGASLVQTTSILCVLTGLPRVDDEAAVVEGGSLHEAVAVSFDLAGVADLGLDDHDGDGTVGDVLAVLQDADPMLAHLARDEGDACEEEEEGEEAVERLKCVIWRACVTDVIVGQLLQ